MTLPRQLLRDTTHLVTRRTTQRQFWLTPRDEVVQIYLYSLGYALSKRQIDLHAFCIMSDHVHLVLTDRDASLPALERDVNSFSARALNVLWERRESLWSSDKPSYVECVAREDVFRMMVYTLANPVNAGLVRSSKDWRAGVSQVDQMGGEPLRIPRPAVFFNPRTMPDFVEIQLVVPDGYRTADEVDEERYSHRFREELRQAVETREADICHRYESEGRPFRGLDEVQGQDPASSPTTDGKSKRNPRIAAADRGKREHRLEQLEAFYDEYEDCRQRLVAGSTDVVFPEGTYWLRVELNVRVRGEPYSSSRHSPQSGSG